METYSSDNIISFSEKIFRCLVTPVPWIAYAGRYSIAKLQQLGFDVMPDLINHNYDPVFEAQNKMSCFVGCAQENIARLQSLPWAQVKSRCEVAAFHNQTLLSELARIWTINRSLWLQNLSRDIR